MIGQAQILTNRRLSSSGRQYGPLGTFEITQERIFTLSRLNCFACKAFPVRFPAMLILTPSQVTRRINVTVLPFNGPYEGVIITET